MLIACCHFAQNLARLGRRLPLDMTGWGFRTGPGYTEWIRMIWTEHAPISIPYVWHVFTIGAPHIDADDHRHTVDNVCSLPMSTMNLSCVLPWMLTVIAAASQKQGFPNWWSNMLQPSFCSTTPQYTESPSLWGQHGIGPGQNATHRRLGALTGR